MGIHCWSSRALPHLSTARPQKKAKATVTTMTILTVAAATTTQTRITRFKNKKSKSYVISIDYCIIYIYYQEIRERTPTNDSFRINILCIVSINDTLILLLRNRVRYLQSVLNRCKLN